MRIFRNVPLGPGEQYDSAQLASDIASSLTEGPWVFKGEYATIEVDEIFSRAGGHAFTMHADGRTFLVSAKEIEET